MVVIHIDGSCINNGYANAYAGAAAVDPMRRLVKEEALPHSPIATSQRAELCGVKLALSLADEIHNSSALGNFSLEIRTDSRYVWGIFEGGWYQNWIGNGWMNASGKPRIDIRMSERLTKEAGLPVANRDLIEEIVEMIQTIYESYQGYADIFFVWIPREENVEADRWARAAAFRGLQAHQAMQYQQQTYPRRETAGFFVRFGH